MQPCKFWGLGGPRWPVSNWPVSNWPVPPASAMEICQPAVGGGGKGAKGPALLTLPGRMPTAGKTPSYGLLSTRPADGFRGLLGHHQAKAMSPASTLILFTQSYFNPVLFDLTHKSP